MEIHLPKRKGRWKKFHPVYPLRTRNRLRIPSVSWKMFSEQRKKQCRTRFSGIWSEFFVHWKLDKTWAFCPKSSLFAQTTPYHSRRHLINSNSLYRTKHKCRSFSIHLGWPCRNSCPRSQSCLIRGKHLRSATSNRDFLNGLMTFGWVHLVHVSLFWLKNNETNIFFILFSILSQTSKNKMNILTIFSNNTFQHHWSFETSLVPSPNLAAMDTKPVPQPSSSTSGMIVLGSGW